MNDKFQQLNNEPVANKWQPRTKENHQVAENINKDLPIRPKASRGRKESGGQDEISKDNLNQKVGDERKGAAQTERGTKILESILNLTDLLSETDLEVLYRLLNKLY